MFISKSEKWIALALAALFSAGMFALVYKYATEVGFIGACLVGLFSWFFIYTTGIACWLTKIWKD